MMILKRIKAGAIQYVLVVSVIIMIVLFAFISLIFLQNRLQTKSQLYNQTIQNSYAAFDYLSQNEIPYNTSTKIQFSELDFEETEVLKKRWGIFDLVIAASKLRNESNTRVALMGYHQNNRKALYLKDNNQPLKVVGNTKIIGDVVLPKRGVSTGNIAGNSYYGEKLIYGQIDKSSEQLPNIKNLEYIKQLMDAFPLENTKYFNLEEEMKLHQSYTEETLVFETPTSFELRSMNLSGNIVLISGVEIQVAASAQLNNVILMAPKITIESNFEGNLQAFASEKIIVGQNSVLEYPSVLAVLDKTDEVSEKQEKITIANGTNVKGVVLYYNDEKSNNYHSQVYIQERARVIGEVYCNKNLELNGSVDGFVYTNNFITRQSGGTFINHVYNAEINSKGISEHYTGLFVGTGTSRVVQWLH